MSGKDRSLAAIMFTDVAGYTRLAQANESLALELLEEHRRVIRPLLEAHNGREVKTIGDGFLVEFKSALEAVVCGVEIQRKMGERNTKVSEERRLVVRVGVHLGDVVHGSGDVYGDAVNVASRIEPLAEPGGVCISRQVYDNIRNKTELNFESMGEIELKNVELPIGVYKIDMDRDHTREGAAVPRERLAVLPFVNISPDPNDEYFADGLTEELITKLSEIRGLKVIARTSVMNYKKKEKSVSTIGRELGVGSVIEGSVRKAGSKIRVTVQLIDPKTEEHLWASNYDSQLDDIFAIQSDVASKVASSISAGIFPKPIRGDTSDVEAYTMYLKAVQRSHDDDQPALREAVVLLDGAIARDPKFARAYAALADVWLRLATGGYEEYSVAESKGEPAARKALELEPGSAEAHAAMAHVSSVLDRFEQAADESREAVRINPNIAGAHLSLGIVLTSLGKLDEGLVSMERSLELDPLSVVTAVLLARTAMVGGKVDRALEIMKRADAVSPNNPKAISALAECYMFKRDFDRAQDQLDRGLKLNPTEPILRLDQGLLFAQTGRKEEAEAALMDLETSDVEVVRAYSSIFINSVLGNIDEAMASLMSSAETHSWPFLINRHPAFEELRKDTRYGEFLRKVGIPG